MTQHLKILSCAFICLASITLHAENLELTECEKLYGHAESRSCLEKLESKIDDQLQETEKHAVGSLLAWDEEENYKNLSIKAFLDSIATFRKYQLKQCDFFWSLAAGGNGAGDMRLSCQIELADQRIRQIAEYVSRKGIDDSSHLADNGCASRLVYGKRKGELYPIVVSPRWDDRDILSTLGLNISKSKVKLELNPDENSVQYKFKSGIAIIAHSEVDGMYVTFAEKSVENPTIEFEIPPCVSQ